VKLPSGAEFEVFPAPREAVKDLLLAVVGELKHFSADEDFSMQVMDAVMSSEAIDNAIKRCLLSCTLDGVDVNESTFAAAPLDYLVAGVNVVSTNLTPFLKGNTVSLIKMLGDL
jgi:hypothetical protein